MRFITALLFLITFSIISFAQVPSKILATANGRSYTAEDLAPNVKQIWNQYPSRLLQARTALLNQQIANLTLQLEAVEKKITVDELIKTEVVKKVPNPSNAEIKAVYDANKNSIGNKTLEEMRPQIISFLRRQPEQVAWIGYVNKLKEKYKVTNLKSINSPDVKKNDVLAKVGELKIKYSDFERENGLQLYEFEANVTEQAIDSLQQSIDAALILTEAKNLGIPSNEYVAREITNKMKDFSPQEEEKLQRELRAKLYNKYKAAIYVKEPTPFIQSVSPDDDPFQGNPNAPVTVIMFTDFQCPACAATHPVLKKVIEEYGNKIKFVVRDFPLQSHENAFNAALAANAANKQGKFFEYANLLYNNQTALDVASLKKYATKAGLNLKKFEKDFANVKFAEEVKKDMKDGEKYSVSSTPSIFVNGYKIRTLSASSFRKAINRALKK